MLVRDGNVLTRVNWTGVLAGVLAGVVIEAALLMLGLAIGLLSATDGLGSLGGIATRAAVWVGLSLAVAAFVTGLTAARAAGYLTPAQGRFNGLLAGMLLLILTSVFTFNVLLAGVNRVLGIAGTAVNTATSAAGAAAGGLGGILQSAGLGDELQAITTGLDGDAISNLIADADPTLSEAQVSAATSVVGGVVTNASRDIQANLSDPAALPGLVTRRADAIQQALSGPQFVTRLQRRGLSQPQAREVANVVQRRVTELRKQATDAAAAAGETANRATATAAATAGRAAWGALLAAGLVLGLATLGGARGADMPARGEVAGGRDEILVERDVNRAVRDDPNAGR